MRHVFKTLSFIGLALTVVPAFLVFSGKLTWDTHVFLMGIGAVLWFATAPFWMVNEDVTHSRTEE